MLSGSIRTTLLAGSAFNATWHLAYPHRVSRFVRLLIRIRHAHCPVVSKSTVFVVYLFMRNAKISNTGILNNDDDCDYQ